MSMRCTKKVGTSIPQIVRVPLPYQQLHVDTLNGELTPGHRLSFHIQFATRVHEKKTTYSWLTHVSNDPQGPKANILLLDSIGKLLFQYVPNNCRLTQRILRSRSDLPQEGGLKPCLGLPKGFVYGTAPTRSGVNCYVLHLRDILCPGG